MYVSVVYRIKLYVCVSAGGKDSHVEWSKQYGASFRTDSVRVKKLTDSMTSLNQFQSMTMTDVGKSVLFGSLFEQQLSSFPIVFSFLLSRNISVKLVKTKQTTDNTTKI